MDYNALNSWISDHGLKKTFIAKKMGICKSSLTKKTKGERPFKAKEVKVFKELGMSAKQMDEFFFE